MLEVPLNGQSCNFDEVLFTTYVSTREISTNFEWNIVVCFYITLLFTKETVSIISLVEWSNRILLMMVDICYVTFRRILGHLQILFFIFIYGESTTCQTF